ncbi:MAG: Crp/Fnr family transcriptional regulator [Burkholderiaceae bacterium]
MSLDSLHWLDSFETLKEIASEDRELISRNASFKRSKPGDIAYSEGDYCEAYVIRLTGWSRVQRTSESGRGIVLYRVGPHETCVLTTSCLVGKSTYPAESIVEEETLDVLIPSAAFEALQDRSEPFRRFVWNNYGRLMSDLIVLIEEVTFRRVDIRLARWLCAKAVDGQKIETTHQEIAVELGSAREVISRLLKDFERKQFLSPSRGQIVISPDSGMRAWVASSSS